MKKLFVLLPAALLAIGGCSDSELTMDGALEKVKKDAGVNDVTMIEQSYNDDRYHFVFEDQTNHYDYVIESDGDFVSKNITAVDTGSTTADQPAGTPIPRPQPRDDSGSNNSAPTTTNDLSMIQAAGTGVAMANGLETVKAAADYITLDNDQDGVADAIEKLILGH